MDRGMQHPEVEQTHVQFTHEGVSCTLPVYTITGAHPGKHMLITAGMHGDEVNGVQMAYHFLETFVQTRGPEELHGTITVVPLLNPLGFAEMNRYVPVDNGDLNRSFGVEKKATFSHFFAEFLYTTFFAHVDHAIDIHDAGRRSALLAHPRIHECEANVCVNCTREMSFWFGSEVVMEREGHEHMLAVYANNVHQLPIMTVEVGGNQRLYREYYGQVMKGITNTLVGLHYLDQQLAPTSPHQYYLSDRYFYTAPRAGILTLHVWLGDLVEVWSPLADIFYPDTGESERFVAKEAGFVFSLWCASQIPQETSFLSLLSSSLSSPT